MSWEPSYHILFVTFFDEVEKHKTKSYVEDFFPCRNNLFFFVFGDFSRYQQYLWAFHILKHTPYMPSLSFGFFVIFHSYGTSHHITIFCKNFCVKVNHDTTQHTTPTHMLDIDTYTQEEEDKEGETGRVRRRRCREGSKLVNQNKETNNGRFWSFSTNLER